MNESTHLTPLNYVMLN
uniref:Uncharacterized protein n=1 Tax=Anguilla anguilla TaxID=7936 RepID=A0A0E9QBM8_ANGAN